MLCYHPSSRRPGHFFWSGGRRTAALTGPRRASTAENSQWLTFCHAPRSFISCENSCPARCFLRYLANIIVFPIVFEVIFGVFSSLFAAKSEHSLPRRPTAFVRALWQEVAHISTAIILSSSSYIQAAAQTHRCIVYVARRSYRRLHCIEQRHRTATSTTPIETLKVMYKAAMQLYFSHNKPERKSDRIVFCYFYFRRVASFSFM